MYPPLAAFVSLARAALVVVASNYRIERPRHE